MVGKKESVNVLNNTLVAIVKLLNDNKIKDWFICYGTLLGLVRENSCIDGDDDVDIIIHKKHFDTLKKILMNNNFELTYDYGIRNTRNILKTKPVAKKYASIDIYMADFNNKDVYDLWNGLNITDCFYNYHEQTFLERTWKGVILSFPKNSIKILINRYGNNWNIKQDKKIPQFMTTL